MTAALVQLWKSLDHKVGRPRSGATHTRTDPRRPIMDHNPPSPVGSWPAIPPSPMGPMSTAREPSLEFCSEPELTDQPNEILMEAETREMVGVRWVCPRKGKLQLQSTNLACSNRTCNLWIFWVSLHFRQFHLCLLLFSAVLPSFVQI